MEVNEEFRRVVLQTWEPSWAGEVKRRSGDTLGMKEENH